MWRKALSQIPRKKLSEAREWLETKGYYKNWKNDYKEDVTKL